MGVRHRPNYRNISQHCWVQHVACVCRSDHLVATCCDMLGVVGSNLKVAKFFMQHVWMLHDVTVVWPGSTNNVAAGHVHYIVQFSTRNISQHVATGWPNACNMLRTTMLRSVAFKCCDRLAGACKCWASNVGICCVEMLLSFGRGFRLKEEVHIFLNQHGCVSARS